MAVYQCLLLDTSTGKAVGEMPISPPSLPTRLNDTGTFTVGIPMTDPMAADDVLNTRGFSGDPDRELLVVRDGTPVRDYTLVNAVGDERSGIVTLSFAEASVWTTMRALEQDKTYDGVSLSHDVYDILRDQFTYHTSKTSNGTTSGGSGIGAAIPRFSISPASGLAGVTKNVAYRGVDRRLWSDIVADIVSDPDFGCDWRVDVGGTVAAPTRTLTFGVPSLGVQVATQLTEFNTDNFGKTLDLRAAGNRAHTVAQGYTYTLQNATSITNGDLLRDIVKQRPDLTDITAIQQFTKDVRRRAQPWVSTYTATYVPDDAGGLPFALCNLGDSVYINYRADQSHFLHTGPGYARVIAIDVTPPTASSPELVALTFNIPLTELGS